MITKKYVMCNTSKVWKSCVNSKKAWQKSDKSLTKVWQKSDKSLTKVWKSLEKSLKITQNHVLGPDWSYLNGMIIYWLFIRKKKFFLTDLNSPNCLNGLNEPSRLRRLFIWVLLLVIFTILILEPVNIFFSKNYVSRVGSTGIN